jgi:hypothetical protein
MKENNDTLETKLRQIYEPAYGRKLKDQEVWEISQNLKAYAEVILRIANQVYNNPP